MRYPALPESLFTENRNRFISHMEADSIAIFASSLPAIRNGDQTYPYRQHSDFFYLSGIEQPNCLLLLQSGPVMEEKQFLIVDFSKAILFIEKPDEKAALWDGPKLTKAQAAAISGIEMVMWLDDFDEILHQATHSSRLIYLNQYNPEKKPVFQFPNEKILNKRIIHDFPFHELTNAASILKRLRLVKSGEELEMIKKAVDITTDAFMRVLKTSLSGKYEYEIQAEVDYIFTKNGCNGHAYAPIIASGANACILHYNNNSAKTEAGDLLLMDFGAEYANYAADLSRTIPVSGRFSRRHKQVYNEVLGVFQQIKALYKPGNNIHLINDHTNQLMEEAMMRLGLFTDADKKNQNPEKPLYKKYFMHGAAHFIGLDVHDTGDKSTTFTPGMVLSCEPGIYIPEEKLGIRLENNLLITQNEAVDLMQHIPVQIEEIEEIMNS